MSTDTDFDRIAQTWLQDGPTTMPDRSLQAALDEVHVTSQRRFGAARRTFDMNGNASRLAVAAVVGLLILVAGGIYLVNDRSSGIGAAPTATPSAQAPTPSPRPSPTPRVVRLSVGHSAMQWTAEFPEGWVPSVSQAIKGGTAAPAGMGFSVTPVDNTFQDPCAHVARSPKIGSTVADATAAFGAIPETTATDPIQATLAGYEATYLELQIPASLPCTPGQFYLFQDAPNSFWWAQGLGGIVRVWILEVEGQRVAIVAHQYPGTSDEVKAEFEAILDSIVFELPSGRPSPSGASPSP